ncbi:Protein pilH [Fibrisoma limi BUZ 3]|uniref:Protein pilH n=1 Tax=Fibrisoma limi BUZ 3 TaxID=1185876 RepID=I2GFB6_9BACT|nr:response regulator [Fibrisoma limi]CCH52591.1 Protein pilH [Fibrisoma limi BUZ 3]
MKTILVIEDTPQMRENIVEILELAPYRVVEASNGKEGVELARSVRPDLILCDIMMPDLDGYGVLHILSKDPQMAHTPFIFLTAKAEAADFRYGMNLGADDYLTKPFDDIALLNAVELRLKKSEQARPPANTLPNHLAQLMQAITKADPAGTKLSEYYPRSRFKKKQFLYTEGGLPTSLFYILSGKVKLFKTDAKGNEYITSIHGPGEFVGYLGLLDGVAHVESALVLEDAEICPIPKTDFLTLLHDNQEVANQFVYLLAGEMSAHRQRLLDLAYQSVRKRVAEALLTYQRKFIEGNPDAGGAAISLSRENWSQLVGASMESVIRTLSDFRNEGLIDINNSDITILNAEKLARLKH